jgi:hypothetical protein
MHATPIERLAEWLAIRRTRDRKCENCGIRFAPGTGGSMYTSCSEDCAEEIQLTRAF